MQLKFEDLPEAIAFLTKEIREIKSLLLAGGYSHEVSPDQWMEINELTSYHPEHPKKSTIYSWVHQSIIPYHKKSKRLLFLKSEIDIWLKSGRIKTFSELEEQASVLLKPKKQKTS